MAGFNLSPYRVSGADLSLTSSKQETRNPFFVGILDFVKVRESQLLTASCVCTQDSFGIRLWAAAHFYHLALSDFSTNLNSHLHQWQLILGTLLRHATRRTPMPSSFSGDLGTRRLSTSPPTLGIPRYDSDE